MSVLSDSTFSWEPATLAETERVLEQMRAFYAEEKLVFDPIEQSSAVRELLTNPALGTILVRREAGRANAAWSGHLVITWACSLEFGGRFVLLDELWIAPEARGRGEGKRALEVAATWARSHGAKALRLEVSHENARARRVYEAAGFTAQTRDLMTLRL